MIELLQVILFRDSQFAVDAGPAIWAALEEVERFYNFKKTRVRVHRIAFEPGLRNPLLHELPLPNSLVSRDRAERFWTLAQGKFRHTLDQECLAKAVRSHLPVTLRHLSMVMVTDQEITPPPEWRYIIWETTQSGSVISAAPLDPRYWSDRTSQRIGAIKHRVRVSSLSITGSFLGLRECNNESCFLYDNVESTDVLDGMLTLGPEHGWEDLTGRGYSPRPRRPQDLQPISLVQAGKEEWLMANQPQPDSEWNTYE